MKSIEKSRFAPYLPEADKALANAAGG